MVYNWIESKRPLIISSREHMVTCDQQVAVGSDSDHDDDGGNDRDDTVTETNDSQQMSASWKWYFSDHKIFYSLTL